MKIVIKKGYIICILLLTLGCFFLLPSMIWAQTYTHTVQKGDTLWSICEKYYGDPDLWPELWQMNPFVTNPHLLEVGDIIVLFEKKPVKKVDEPMRETKLIEKEPPVEKEKPESPTLGYNFGGFTDFKTIGFLSLGPIQPLGTIIAADNEKLILSKGDTAYVLFDKPEGVEIGKEYCIGTPSPLLKHPLVRKNLGHTFSISGRLVIESRSVKAIQYNKYYDKDNVFRVKITEFYKPIHLEEFIMPVQSISQCVLPIDHDTELLANIVAAKDQKVLISIDSIVYIDLGFNQGVNRGNMFQIVRPQVIKDPKPNKEKPWEPVSKLILPDIPIGSIMILESRPNTSSAIVLTASEEFSTGAYIKNMPWEEVTEFMTTMRDTCLIQ